MLGKMEELDSNINYKRNEEIPKGSYMPNMEVILVQLK